MQVNVQEKLCKTNELFPDFFEFIDSSSTIFVGGGGGGGGIVDGGIDGVVDGG